MLSYKAMAGSLSNCIFPQVIIDGQLLGVQSAFDGKCYVLYIKCLWLLCPFLVIICN